MTYKDKVSCGSSPPWTNWFYLYLRKNVYVCICTSWCNTLQHPATHCKVLQHTCLLLYVLRRVLRVRIQYSLQRNATHCDTLQHPATPCNTLQHTATQVPFNICSATGVVRTHLVLAGTHCNALQRAAIHCNTFQQTATHSNTLQTHTANTLQHAATSNTLQHTTTHGNTRQRIAATHTANTLQTHCKHTATNVPINVCSAASVERTHPVLAFFYFFVVVRLELRVFEREQLVAHAPHSHVVHRVCLVYVKIYVICVYECVCMCV